MSLGFDQCPWQNSPLIPTEHDYSSNIASNQNQTRVLDLSCRKKGESCKTGDNNANKEKNVDLYHVKKTNESHVVELHVHVFILRDEEAEEPTIWLLAPTRKGVNLMIPLFSHDRGVSATTTSQSCNAVLVFVIGEQVFRKSIALSDQYHPHIITRRPRTLLPLPKIVLFVRKLKYFDFVISIRICARVVARGYWSTVRHPVWTNSLHYQLPTRSNVSYNF